MNKIYLKIVLSSEGEPPKRILERMKKVGALPLVGDLDFELELGPDEKLFDKLDKVHRALKGSRVRYTVTTLADSSRPLEGDKEARSVAPLVELKPSDVKRSVYREKLDRWREMGLDVSELEALLEEDIDHFKEASKEFLKVHLNHTSVVSDKHPPENQVDGEVLALLTEEGKTIETLATASGYTEDQVTLSLGRLISSGSAKRSSMKDVEVYTMVQPHAPPPVKRLRLLPAENDEEAEDRVYSALAPSGSTKEQILRATRLPEDQMSKALRALSKKGRIRVRGKGKTARFAPV